MKASHVSRDVSISSRPIDPNLCIRCTPPSVSRFCSRAERTASGKVCRRASLTHASPLASAAATVMPAARCALRCELSVTPWSTVAPRMNAWSRSSTLEERNVAASASVRATISVDVPITSACSRAATRRSQCSCAGTRTLPPMCPHFLVPGAWSSKWIPAAPASIIIFVNFITAVRPPCPVSPSATMGVRKSGRGSSSVPDATAACHALRSWN
mmetsp:Transcript_11096/g.25583  ORF Transcript_11096/g.25583 Transcript_11096/m.25583 type:complete len:214 (-) Transcript_11096:513-1154(-)